MDDLDYGQLDYAKHIVTPFGQSGYVQGGVAITKIKGLKDRFVMADDSELDLNPEFCLGLKRRLYGR